MCVCQSLSVFTVCKRSIIGKIHFIARCYTVKQKLPSAFLGLLILRIKNLQRHRSVFLRQHGFLLHASAGRTWRTATGSSAMTAIVLIQYLIHTTPSTSNDSAIGTPEVQLVCGNGEVRVVVAVTPSVLTARTVTVTTDGITTCRRVTRLPSEVPARSNST